MSNRLFPKITGAIASPLHIRASTPSLHAFVHIPPPLDPIRQYYAILKELRQHGSDQIWPRSVNDDNFSTAIGRIATQASEKLSVPLPVVEDAVSSMMWPRMLPLLEAEEQNLRCISELERTRDLTEKEGEHDHKTKGFKLDDVPDVYWEYKGTCTQPGTMLTALRWATGYKEFQAVMKDARPKGFADDPEEMWGFKFKILWSTGGMWWYRVGHEVEFRQLCGMAHRNKWREFTFLFFENHCVPGKSRDGGSS